MANHVEGEGDDMRPRASLLWPSLLAALIAAGCGAKRAPYNPFQVSRDQFYGNLKTIALAPVRVPGDLEDPEPVRAKFESLLEAEFREAGFTVVPPKEAEAIWSDMAEQVGGFYDPVTGERDPSKADAVREHTLRELKTRFNADALLYPSVQVVQARFEKDKAVWDGTEEKLAGGGIWKLLFGSSHSGTVPALSLVVVLEDMNGTDLYIKGGGIQVLSRIAGDEFVPVPRYQLFADEERNVAAVHLALDPLLGRMPTEER